MARIVKFLNNSTPILAVKLLLSKNPLFFKKGEVLWLFAKETKKSTLSPPPLIFTELLMLVEPVNT
jgi:hypothetical protein